MATKRGTDIRNRRLELGLSKEAVARAAGVSVITYKKVEDDRPVRDTSMASVAAALDRLEGGRRDATVHAKPGTTVPWTRPDWMDERTHRRILHATTDFYRYQVQQARRGISDDEVALGDLFGTNDSDPLPDIDDPPPNVNAG